MDTVLLNKQMRIYIYVYIINMHVYIYYRNKTSYFFQLNNVNQYENW